MGIFTAEGDPTSVAQAAVREPGAPKRRMAIPVDHASGGAPEHAASWQVKMPGSEGVSIPVYVKPLSLKWDVH